MQYNELGRTGISVSHTCLGTMTWGEQNTEADGHAQIDYALSRGVNFIDTAEMYSVPARAETYGSTEKIIGSWIRKTGRRQDIVLATKVAGAFPGRDMSYMRPHINDGVPRLDRASILAACDTSLKRLNTDYIDLYQLHWPERPTNYFGVLRYRKIERDTTPLEETLSALKELVDAGKVRAVGVSNETAWGVSKYLSLSDKLGLPRIASIQNPYSLLNRSFEVGLAEFATEEQVGLLAYSPLAFGVLSGKYLNGARPEGARLTKWHETFPRYWGEKATRATEKYVALAKELSLTPAILAHAFVYNQPWVTANIVGATNLDQLKEAIDAASVVLDKNARKAIDAIEDQSPFPCP